MGWRWQTSMEFTKLIADNRTELLEGVIELSRRQRVCFVVGTKLTGEEALTMDTKEITMEWLREHAIEVKNLLAAGIGPRQLFRMGIVSTPVALRDFGYDSLYLHMYPAMAEEVAQLYTPVRCREVWLVNSSDALALAGSPACGHIGATLERLMERCVGQPKLAEEVLRETENSGFAVRGFEPQTLLATDITSGGLMRGGVTMNDVIAMGASTAELEKLGYCGLRMSFPIKTDGARVW